ncbi:hypothetical protein GMRT_12947 [Giardia muris]|uniref:Uncharacterized protein n=1 Tax=Giardia muris TaxID=5742 RepID=A0A4Z1ST38_GIAMU|nr:hypothetical protein GMRT_12947 [Giardia muris]|eukprot:TNJ29096.1 hypothetical protein GMRT_12947 [Giardia muris]
MNVILLHQPRDGVPCEMEATLECRVLEHGSAVELTLSSVADMFFLFEVIIGRDPNPNVFSATTFDSLHPASLPTVLAEDIVPNLSRNPERAGVGCDICLLESNASNATLQFMTVRPHMRVPFFKVLLQRGSDHSIARHIAAKAAALEVRLGTELNDLQARCSCLEADKAAAVSQQTALETRLTHLIQSHRETELEMERRIEALRVENTTLQEVKRELERDLAGIHSQLEKQSHTAGASSELLRGEITNLKSRIMELEQTVARQERQLAEERLASSTEIARLQGENSSLRTRLTAGEATRRTATPLRSASTDISTASSASRPRSTDSGRRQTVRFVSGVSGMQDPDLTESSLDTKNTGDRARSTNARNILAKYGIYSRMDSQAGSIPPKPTIPTPGNTTEAVRQRLRNLELRTTAPMQSATSGAAPLQAGERVTMKTANDVLSKYSVTSTGSSANSGTMSLSHSTLSLLQKHLPHYQSTSQSSGH